MAGSAKLGTSLAVALAGALATPAQVAAADCSVDVYMAYTTAVKRGWKFYCENATFVPEHAFRAISCQGKTPPIVPPAGITVKAQFWDRSTATVAQLPKFNGGWQMLSYEVSGGNWSRLFGKYARVGFVADITAPNASFKRRLTKLKLRKSDGDCSKVYDEAF